MSVPWYLMAKGKGGGGYKIASGPIVSVNDALAALLRSLSIGIDPVQEGTGDPSPDNVRPISGWSAVNVWVKPAYDPTANPTATIQFGDTVYGGTLDVINGVLTVDRAMVDLGTLNWSYNSTRTRFETSEVQSTIKPATNNNTPINALCESYNVVEASKVQSTDFSVGATNIGAVLVHDSRYSDANTFKAAVSGVKLCYELATPLTIPLTATEISTLQGQNNVWADSGDVTLEYLASGGANADLMKLAVAFMGKGVK